MIERTRDADSLPLAAGETDSAIADQCLCAVSLRADHRLETSKVNSTLHRSHVNLTVGNSESHVAHNGIVPQVDTLGDVTNLLAPNGKILPDIVTVHRDAAV